MSHYLEQLLDPQRRADCARNEQPITPIQLVRIEARAWYEHGKYMGDKATWWPVDRSAIEQELTGDFFGEWVGRKHFDGKAILQAHIDRCIEHHGAAYLNDCPEVTHHAVPRGDWGEYRIVTGHAFCEALPC